MKSIYTIENGARVQGTYCGTPYVGTVREQRQHTMNHKIRLFSVDLDAPLVVFGMERKSLMISAAERVEDLQRYLGGGPVDAVAIEEVAHA